MNVRAIREAFGMRKSEFAKCLNVAQNTISRWEAGQEPKGLARAVLRGMEAALDRLTPEEALMKGGQLRLGVGAYLYYELNRYLK